MPGLVRVQAIPVTQPRPFVLAQVQEHLLAVALDPVCRGIASNPGHNPRRPLPHECIGGGRIVAQELINALSLGVSHSFSLRDLPRESISILEFLIMRVRPRGWDSRSTSGGLQRERFTGRFVRQVPTRKTAGAIHAQALHLLRS